MSDAEFFNFIKQIEHYEKDMVHFSQIFSDFDESMSKYSPIERAGVFAGMFSEIRNRKVKEDNPEENAIYALCFAHYSLKASGCDAWADKITELIPIIRGMEFGANTYVRSKISEEKRAARKGKCNRHKPKVLEIATDTWSAYPNASLPGIRDEIYAHLRAQWNDCPASDTINGWLKESGLNPPNGGVKNRKFDLVL